MRKFYLLSTLVLAMLCGGISHAQDFSNKGKDFWVAYGYHERMGQASPAGGTQDMILYFAAEQLTNVTVTIPGVGYSQSYVVLANTVIASNPIPKAAPQDVRLNAESIAPENKGIHITSDKPIVAYAHIYNSSVSGASILFPTTTLGKEYYSINFKNISNTNNSNCWFYVIATDTGITRIEITPSANTINHPAGTTFTINLTQGQVYNLMGTFSNPPASNPAQGVDLTGSKIVSVATASGGCKKIAVFSGSGRISITCNANSASSDNYMVQAFPKSAWGKKFLTVPTVSYTVNGGNTASASVVNYYRICVADPTTIVKINGVVTVLPLINNFYYEIPATTALQLIEGDKPITVAQYLPSQGAGTACGTSNGDGDPETIYLSPVEQNINKVLWNASARFQINTSKHYINAVIPNTGTAISSFKLDGVTVPAASFVVHPQDPGFAYARINVASVTGNPTLNTGIPHIIQSDSGFNAIAYGYGGAESYGYNAGTNIKDIYQYITIQNQHATVNFPATCRNTPFNFSMTFPYQPGQIQWVFGAALNAMGILDTTLGPPPPTPTSTIIVAGKTLYVYKLPSIYFITAPGTYPIKVIAVNPTPDGCGNQQEIDFDLQVFDPPIADFTFINNGCVTNPVAFFDNSNPGGRPVIERYWNFGDANTSTINNPTHLYAGPGSYNVKYQIITDVGCLSDTALHVVTVNDLPVANFSIPPVNCVNVPVSFTDNSAAGPGATLQQWTWNFGDASPPVVITAPASPNVMHTYTTPGSYNATLLVQTATGCQSLVYTLQVTISPDATINLTSAVGTNNQTVCINTPITNITYAVGGSGNGGSVSGLPAGVSGTYAGGAITITGTPTVSGTFNYTVNTTGPCVTPTANGTITVTPDGTITLTSAAGTNNQTVCINIPITNITYAVTGSGNGGSVSGLPAGVSGSYTGGVITITGTPTVSGTFNYTVNTTGPCVTPTATGTIIVTPDATINLTSAVGTNNQTVCINTPITNITYAVGGSGNGGSVSGLPAGVSGTYAGGTIAITGSPTVSGIFNYTVSTTGPCVTPTATGTITVTPDATISLTSAPPTTAQELCRNSTITNITYAVAGSGSGATVVGLPAGVTGVYAGGIFTISGAPTVSGIFNYTVTTTGPCAQSTATGTITVNPLPTSNFNFNTPSCETRTISFTDMSVPNAGNIISWQWNFGDGSPVVIINAPTSPNVTHTYAAAGTYNVLLVVTTNKGCISITPSQQVVIHSRPLAGFIIPEVCLSDTYAQFTDTSKVTAPDLIQFWEWNFGDPGSGPLNTSNSTNPQHSYTATGAYNVQLIVTSNNSCKDTIMQVLFVNGSFPAANFNVQNPATLCANDSVAIAEASTVFPGTITKVEIYWDNVGQPGVFVTDNFPFTGKIYKHLFANFQAPLTKTFTIRYRAYSGGVCVNDKLKNITVNAAPKVQFNNMPNVCLDAAPFQITQASEIGGVPGPPGIFSGPGVSPTGIFNPAAAGVGTHNIKFTFTSTAGGCIDTLTKPIIVLDSASARFTFPATNCEGSSVSFNSTTSTIPPASGTITGWTWDFGDPASGAANSSPLQNPTHTFTGWGTYNVKLFVTTSNGCKSTVRTIAVFVNPIPKPNFSTPASSCLPSANVVFNSSSSTIADGSQASFIYLWDFGDPASGPLNTATGSSPSHIYNTAGPFSVNLQITSGVGCVNNKTILLTTVHPQPTGSFTSSKNDVCVGESFTFTDNSNPADGITSQLNWTMGDGNTRTGSPVIYTYGSAGSYDVSLYIINSHGCRSTTFTKNVTVNPYPIVNAGPDLFILQDGNDTIQPLVTAITPSYLWTPNLYFLSSNTVMTPIVKGVEDITYTLTVTGRGGCVSTDQVFIKVLKGPEIPNIFSPNGDGVHDKWVIKYLDTYPGSTVDIFNRYGQLIYHAVGYSVPWDGKVNGKEVPIGTYYYIVNPKNGRKIMSGYVDVIR